MVGCVSARLGGARLTHAAALMRQAAPVREASGIERFAAMGTRVELHRFGPGAADALMLARRAIEAVDDALTIHRPSAATALNEALRAGGTASVDDPILFDALTAIDAAQAATEGLFDPAAQVGRAGAGWRALRFDTRAATIASDAPVALDFGGFGKGYALDRATAALRDAGVVCALLSAGESSIAVVGEHPLGGAWPFAVPHPCTADRTLIEVELVDEALSISATVGAGALALDRAASVRPGDGTAVIAPRTAVVVDRSGATAEMLSTALIVADAGQARRLQIGGRRMLFELADGALHRMAW